MRVRYIVTCLLVFLTGCGPGKINTVTDFKIKIPDADIVFNTIEAPKGDELFGEEVLGFYTFGMDRIEFLDTGSNLITPFFIGNELLVALDKQGNPGLILPYLGRLVILSNGQYRYCTSRSEASGWNLHGYSGNVLIELGGEIKMIDVNTCEVIGTLIKTDDLQNIESTVSISTFDLSKNGRFLLLSFSDKRIVRVDLPQKTIHFYEIFGMYPSLSPDNEHFAFLGSDGIHIADIDGKIDRVLVDCGLRKFVGEDCFERGNAPKPQWSKDGNKLIYHRCNASSLNCSEIEDFDIYIYNFETNQERLIIRGGLNPSWNYFKN
jgi:hypothetical protein